MGSSLSPELTVHSKVEFKLRSNLDMHKRSIWTISPMALILASALPPILGAQTAPPKSVDDIQIEKWNSVPLPGLPMQG